MESYPEEGERNLSGDKCSLKGDLKDLKVFPNGGNGNHTKSNTMAILGSKSKSVWL